MAESFVQCERTMKCMATIPRRTMQQLNLCVTNKRQHHQDGDRSLPHMISRNYRNTTITIHYYLPITNYH